MAAIVPDHGAADTAPWSPLATHVFDEPVTFLAILSPATFDGPALIDVSREEPWCSLKEPMEV